MPYRTPVTASYNEACPPRSDSRQNVIINRVELATRSYRYVDYQTAVTAWTRPAHRARGDLILFVVETDLRSSGGHQQLGRPELLGGAGPFQRGLTLTHYTPTDKRIDRTAKVLAKAVSHTMQCSPRPSGSPGIVVRSATGTHQD